MSYTYAGRSYPTKSKAAIASAVDFITAEGNHHTSDVERFASEGPHENLRQARYYGWDPIDADVWRDEWDEITEQAIQVVTDVANDPQ